MSAAQGSADWFKEREGKLTASAFGQAAGLGPGSRQQLWRRLMGVEVFEGNPATEWGKQHEPIAYAAYTKRYPLPPASSCGFMQHPSLPWLGASPDFLIGAGPLGVGEIKCPVTQKLYDTVPDYYVAQVQGQMQVANVNFAHFVCWTPNDMRVWRIDRSNEYWDWLHLRLADFWCWVVAKIEPPREAKFDPSEIPKVNISLI